MSRLRSRASDAAVPDPSNSIASARSSKCTSTGWASGGSSRRADRILRGASNTAALPSPKRNPSEIEPRSRAAAATMAGARRTSVSIVPINTPAASVAPGASGEFDDPARLNREALIPDLPGQKAITDHLVHAERAKAVFARDDHAHSGFRIEIKNNLIVPLPRDDRQATRDRGHGRHAQRPRERRREGHLVALEFTTYRETDAAAGKVPLHPPRFPQHEGCRGFPRVAARPDESENRRPRGRAGRVARQVVGEPEHPFAELRPAPASADTFVVADEIDFPVAGPVVPVAARTDAGFGLPAKVLMTGKERALAAAGPARATQLQSDPGRSRGAGNAKRVVAFKVRQAKRRPRRPGHLGIELAGYPAPSGFVEQQDRREALDARRLAHGRTEPRHVGDHAVAAVTREERVVKPSSIDFVVQGGVRERAERAQCRTGRSKRTIEEEIGHDVAVSPYCRAAQTKRPEAIVPASVRLGRPLARLLWPAGSGRFKAARCGPPR